MTTASGYKSNLIRDAKLDLASTVSKSETENYSSMVKLHHDGVDGKPGTTVESFIVDVPDGNTVEDTCIFVEHLIKTNLRPLASVSVGFARQQQQQKQQQQQQQQQQQSQ